MPEEQKLLKQHSTPIKLLTTLGCRSENGSTPGSRTKAIECSHSHRVPGVFAQPANGCFCGGPTTYNYRLEWIIDNANVVDVLFFLAAVNSIADEFTIPRFTWWYLQRREKLKWQDKALFQVSRMKYVHIFVWIRGKLLFLRPQKTHDCGWLPLIRVSGSYKCLFLRRKQCSR